MSSTRRTERKSRDETGFPPVVLVTGKEATLRRAAIAELRERVIGDGPADFNEDRIDLATGDPGRVLTAACTLPVLAPARLVVVRGLGDRRAKPFLENGLPGYLEAPTPTTCLVLELESVDKRLRWVKQVQKIGALRDCSGPSRPGEVRAWIEGEIRALRKKPGRGAAVALYDAVGADLDRLAGEIEKVCLYVGDAQQVTAEDVAEVSNGVRPLAVYELTDAIGARRISAALTLLQRLMGQGEAPLAVLGALANHFRKLLRARECEPLQKDVVQRALQVHPFAAEKLAEQARRFDPRRLERCLDAIAQTDSALKGGVPLPPRLAIERLVLAVCA